MVTRGDAEQELRWAEGDYRWARDRADEKWQEYQTAVSRLEYADSVLVAARLEVQRLEEVRP